LREVDAEGRQVHGYFLVSDDCQEKLHSHQSGVREHSGAIMHSRQDMAVLGLRAFPAQQREIHADKEAMHSAGRARQQELMGTYLVNSNQSVSFGDRRRLRLREHPLECHAGGYKCGPLPSCDSDTQRHMRSTQHTPSSRYVL
jgi:hypothetical protein